MVRLMIHPLLQAGTSVPMFALTQRGKELIIERAKEIDSPILVITADLPVLPDHKQPGRSDNGVNFISCTLPGSCHNVPTAR